MASPVSHHLSDGVPLSEELSLLRAAAREAGMIAMTYFHGHEDNTVELKNGKSPVSTADYAVDRYLRERLMTARPGYGWLSEETEDTEAHVRLAAQRTFVVDPIDGTRAFIDGRDTWCVSVAIVEADRTIAGVLDCPALDEIYYASEGGGAWKNGERLHVAEGHDRPVIAGNKTVLDQFEEAFPEGLTAHRHIPSLAYRLAMVADGSLDATVVKPKAHDWDIAAAELILREAGGRLTQLDGAPVLLNGKSPGKPAMLAGNPGTLAHMFGVVTAEAFG